MKTGKKITKGLIKENVKRFRQGKPLTVPLALLGRTFKQKVYRKFPTPEVRKKRLEDNKEWYEEFSRRKNSFSGRIKAFCKKVLK